MNQTITSLDTFKENNPNITDDIELATKYLEFTNKEKKAYIDFCIKSLSNDLETYVRDQKPLFFVKGNKYYSFKTSYKSLYNKVDYSLNILTKHSTYISVDFGNVHSIAQIYSLLQSPFAHQSEYYRESGKEYYDVLEEYAEDTNNN